jgi:hypothetical protein
MNNLEKQLGSFSPETWKTDQVIILDWMDGPRYGVCRLEKPSCEFVFDCVYESNDGEGLETRFFGLRELPTGAVQKLIMALSRLGTPTGTIWVPRWSFATEQEKEDAEATVDQILSLSSRSTLAVQTDDFRSFLRCMTIPLHPERLSA